jgi:large subunit ribosomal protein L31
MEGSIFLSSRTITLDNSSTKTKNTIVWENGEEYPLMKLEISNTSHPFFTGKTKLVDTAGRLDKYLNKYKSHLDKKVVK